ncbi:hypothetical protein PF007_g30393 [Phytophthora fragariae]|uniref:Uncharacterized protein n=1 Tax=Phytophthora fragariae TaxID=53985 RepID=A0A6A3PW50_9STRA|nr:hypothetical protein PF007_g30393 [Phytophthora fragariae]
MTAVEAVLLVPAGTLTAWFLVLLGQRRELSHPCSPEFLNTTLDCDFLLLEDDPVPLDP